MKRSRLLFVSLVAVTLLCSVVAYVRVYFGRHNSLWDNAAYLVLLSSLVWLYPRDFKRFVLSKRNYLNGLTATVTLLLLIDLAVNMPLNLYKVQMYALVYAIYILCFLFTKLREDRKVRFVGYLLMTWLAVSVVELYLRMTEPQLFFIFPWRGMTLQSAMGPLVSAGHLSWVNSKVYGLGIGSQANAIALMSLLMVVLMGGFSSMATLFKVRLVKFLLVCTAVVILPFALSLNSVMALVCAVGVVVLKRTARFKVQTTLVLSSIAAVVAGIFVFDIGTVFGFSANTESRAGYMYELVYWPLEFFRDNATLISLGLHNDLSIAPLENKYFNIVLALGVPLFLYIAVFLCRVFVQLMRRSATERNGPLKLMLFTLFCVSYLHIAFLNHVPGFMLLGTMFVFVTERVHLVPLQSRGRPA